MATTGPPYSFEDMHDIRVWALTLRAQCALVRHEACAVVTTSREIQATARLLLEDLRRRERLAVSDQAPG